MLLAIAIGLGLISIALAPLGEGLFDTSMWAAKMMLPPETGKSENAEQVMKVTQASLMEGWLSNIPFLNGIATLSSIVVAGFCHWWLAIVFYVVVIILKVFAKLFWTRQACHYLVFMYHKMANRAADYRRENDAVRFEAAEATLKDLEKIISIYDGTRLRPPTAKQLKEVPYGDMHYWCNRWAGSAAESQPGRS